MSSTLQRPTLHPRQTSSSSFAAAFEIARSKLERISNEQDYDSFDNDTPASPLSVALSGDWTLSPASPITPITPYLEPEVADDFAFAFDIDGVLIRGGEVIPEAVEAMKVLNGENEYGIKVY